MGSPMGKDLDMSFAVLGPPWISCEDPASVLLGDPPRILAFKALAIIYPETLRLRRVACMESAYALAGSELAIVLRGAIKLQSGRWLWPHVRAVINNRATLVD